MTLRSGPIRRSPQQVIEDAFVEMYPNDEYPVPLGAHVLESLRSNDYEIVDTASVLRHANERTEHNMTTAQKPTIGRIVHYRAVTTITAAAQLYREICAVSQEAQ